jgi:hypothetical protein
MSLHFSKLPPRAAINSMPHSSPVLPLEAIETLREPPEILFEG